MEKFKISACFYPTTVLFVDDNPNFLDMIKLHLDRRFIIPRFYHDPLEALQFFEEDYDPSPFIERCVLHPEEEQFDHRLIDIDINNIRNEAFNSLRFNEISVVVIDHTMPTLNGLDLCLLIREKDPRLPILMLTGEADQNVAVQAFNEGSIDRFIRKDTPEFTTQLNKTVYELQQRYFSDLSQVIFDSLAEGKRQKLVKSCLDNPEFLGVFQRIYQENQVVEYYLTDAYGSFLFLDVNGQPSWLAVKDEEGMTGAYEVALYSDTPFPDELLETMRLRKKLLYLYEGGLCADPKLARKWLYPANKIQSANVTYYYAYIKDPKTYDINLKKIISYQSYLKTAPPL